MGLRQIAAVALIWCAGLGMLWADGAGAGPFGGKKVLVIGIDGCRPDALKRAETPHMDGLIASGAVTWDSFAGGQRGTPSEQVTSSGPGWTSILTGVWRDKHRVSDNSFSGYRVDRYPHFFRRVREVEPTACLASFVSWGPIDDSLVSRVREDAAVRFKGIGADYSARDRSVTNRTVRYLGEENPDVVMVHLDQVDGAGHATGFSPLIRSYLRAIENVDGMIGEILEAIRARSSFETEDWLVIITTDHGGTGRSHGGQSMSERQIFFIVSGGRATAREISEGPGHVAVVPTTLHHLGIARKDAWGFDSGPFGLPPFCPDDLTAESGSDSVVLSWRPASEILIDGLEVHRDGLRIATLPKDAASFVDTPPLDGPPGLRSFTYEIIAAGGVDSAVCPPLRVVADIFNGSFESELAVDLVFGEEIVNAVPGSAMVEVLRPGGQGSLQRVPGPWGDYAEIGSGGAISLGSSLSITEDASFTIAVLARRTHSDLPGGILIANKDTTDRTALGWEIEVIGNGAWHWSGSDSGLTAAFSDPGALFADGNWHHLAMVVDRRVGEAAFFADASLVGKVSLGQLGGLWGETALVVGADSTGGQAFSGSLGGAWVWKRALGAGELTDWANELLASVPRLGIDPALSVDVSFDAGTANGATSDVVPISTSDVRFEPGVLGGAAFLPNSGGPPQYISLGNGAALDFGEDVDFTVSVWVKAEPDQAFGENKSDPAILANKDWRSGIGPGWLLAVGRNGGWQWNIGDGVATHRADYDSPSNVLVGSDWHHLAVSHDRDGTAALYFDGELVGMIPIRETGSVASGLPVVVGTDGAFGENWPAWFNGAIDELRIWKRMLSATEVATEFGAVTAMGAWQTDHFSNAVRADLLVAGLAADPDGDGADNLLEFALGSSPVDPGELPELKATHEEGLLSVSYLERPRTHGIHYTLETTTRPEDPDSWSPGKQVLRAEDVREDGWSRATVQSIPTANRGRHEYVRLRVQWLR